MELVFVTDKFDRTEYQQAIEDYASGRRDQIPRKVWVDYIEDRDSLVGTFVVVDNSTGDCWVEEFESLDGAVLYATQVRSIPEKDTEWDYPGAVKDVGDLVEAERE